MRNKIMKSKRAFKMPMWATAVVCAAIFLAAFAFSGRYGVFGHLGQSVALEKLAYVGTLAAMPEATANEIKNMKNDIKEILLGQKPKAEKLNFFQKSGEAEESETEEDNLGNTDDLSVTPDDILKSMAAVQKKFDDGEYKEDGVVAEKTFTDDQSTDSFKNIHVRNVTDGAEINIEDILNTPFGMGIEDISAPTVLIYHTHSTETYIMNDNGKFSTDFSSRNEDKSVNMIRIGDEITRILKSRGIGVIHDREIYDYTYTGAYGKSRVGVEAALKKYPTIKITLDIHRDAVYYDDYTRMKPVTEIDGEKAAQMMIIAGAEGGNVSEFPSWKTNLQFALNLQKTVNGKYENLMKPIFFCNRKYNMDMTPYSLLIEVGTDANSLKEAAYSGRLLGDALADLIKQRGSAEEK